MLLSQHTKWLAICGATAAAIGFGLHYAAQTPVLETANTSQTTQTSDDANSSHEELAEELILIREDAREHTAAMQTIAKQIIKMQERQQQFDQQLNSLQTGGALKNSNQPSSEPPDDGLTDEERLNQYHRQNIAGAEEKIRTETVDQAWRSKMEAELTASMAAIDIEGSQLTLAQCAASLCKIRVDHQDQTNMTEFLYKLPTVKPWNTGAYIDTEQQGNTYTTTIYLAREGKDLPEPVRTQ